MNRFEPIFFLKKKPLFEKSEQFYDHSPPSTSKALVRRWLNDHFAFDVQTKKSVASDRSVQYSQGKSQTVFMGGRASSPIIFERSVFV